MNHRILTLAISSLCLLSFSNARAQQTADPKFDTRVDKPAFTKNFPRVLFDEAHNNLDNTSGRYRPFADLLFNDGYHIAVNRQPFTKQSLATHKILIITNPLSVEDVDEEGADHPAFTSEECEAVNDWIHSGGALLLIVDAVPFGSATEILATRLGIEMSKTQTIDPANTEKELAMPGVIVYSRENHQLAESSITNGRDATERLDRVLVFSGQSLKGPPGSDTFLKLADTALEEVEAPGKNTSAAGRAQGIAFRLGKGRVVVLGDAAMLSAQLTGSDNQPVGMNVANVDNRKLALNIMHWLSGMLK